jgi:hypothetical protein
VTDLVSELQARALDPTTSVTDLLRIAKVVAVKLRLDEFLLWINSELGGYKDLELPAYRILRGEMKARNPYRGFIPVTFATNEWADLAETIKLHQKISEVEILAQTEEGRLHFPISDEAQSLLRKMFQQDMEFVLLFPSVALSGIVEAVRDVILDWSLELEKSGIKGEGMSFSKEDKAKAHAPGVTYQINKIENFTGNMGAVSDHGSVNATTTIGFDSKGLADLIGQLEQSKEQFGLTGNKQRELAETLSALRTAMNGSTPKPSKIGQLLGVARTIIQTAGSSLLVQGALYEIDKFKQLIHG